MPKLFEAAELEIGKKEFYLIAEQMQPAEIAREVRDKLDAIQRAFGLSDA